MQSIKDTYLRIADTIVEQLETGTNPGSASGAAMPAAARSFRAEQPAKPRRHHVIMLLVAGQTFGSEENIWVTYREAQDLGASPGVAIRSRLHILAGGRLGRA